ncbi:adenylate/guanylate cyclase domain-containing protein [Mesorhizobium sp. LHD-90]|uniref:adenylate/guanylate cyclase domain-containing protein n=1 Tax=Mesorhizobium sp. LHD-90 TaxID=3071414 RepID=UPI0027E103FD|nr:adenylate/guanylate cyclase domain-containing protein [Mesorhizobium sp. LHD-90]MDQ6436445.1 adenylate/guanylate cyclase domain-containing protein [Mesorhizobium sp. LHD-90]
MERRLAAILAADVVGFSRLMGVDEAATLAALTSHRGELIDRKVAEHHGRIVKSTGDGILVEFPSVVNAVTCAADIQREMRLRNADVPPARRIEFRIGVNLGDVIAVEGDVFGDGVNVAARIESIARPGGVAVSATVRDHIGNRLALSFEDRGPQNLKNIEQQVGVFDLVLDASATGGSAVASPLPEAAPAPNRSIAVLPFANLSGDADQEYFADGITEDIITDLAKISALSVIARNSTFTYKGRHSDVQEVARRFNVAYVLEGSVRKAGQRVRITAQLIEAKGGTHLWADRYDRNLTDIFALQDEITRAIVEQLKVKLLPREAKAIETVPTRNFEAYDYYLQARHLFHLHTQQHVILAQRMFGKAIELDPGYARAYAGLADCAWFLYNNQHDGTSVEDIHLPSLKALEIDPGLAEAHASYGMALHYLDRYPEAVAEFERAIELDPGNYEVSYFYGMAARDRGDLATAARMQERSIAVSPEDYREWIMLAQTYKELGRHEDARRADLKGLEQAERALATNPEVSLAATFGAGTLASLGDRKRALEWLSRALTMAPDDPLTLYNAACAYAVLGESEQALDLLDRWATKATGVTAIWLLDSDFQNIHDHPRFQALLARFGLPAGPTSP